MFSVASPSQDYRVTSTRPLPAGTYGFHFNHRGPYYGRCEGYAFRYEWTVTVNAPAGTLHEAFFDPVTDGSAVAADSANGVLKPASFTDANGASATLERIAWEPGVGESGTVKVKLNLHTGLTGHVVDFIALDGSVPLSLKIADATVDAANRTLSWTVASQPWEDDDKLMLRVRKGCGSGTTVTNPGANPGAGVGLRGAAGGQGHPKKTKTCAQHARIYWTDQSVLDQQPVPSLSDSYYYYIDSIMIHEFGHTFGLPDFYADTTGLQGLPAVMDNPYTNQTPTIEDIEQLRAMYALHEPTDHSP